MSAPSYQLPPDLTPDHGLSAGEEFFAVTDPDSLFLKATPFEEGVRRFIFIEASNETRDYAGEIVLMSALQASKAYYEKYGNLDLDHITQIGPLKGIPKYPLFEIGRPVEVRVTNSVFVKAELYRGEGKTAENANVVWDSLVNQDPPQRWFPSVGGATLKTRESAAGKIITAVRWTNIGLSKTPVNLGVAEISRIPVGAFAKAFSMSMGLDLDLAKSLAASPEMSGGVAGDSSTYTGGAALGRQSLDRNLKATTPRYRAWRDQVAASIKAGRHKPPMTVKSLADWSADAHGIAHDEATGFAARFLADLPAHLQARRGG